MLRNVEVEFKLMLTFMINSPKYNVKLLKLNARDSKMVDG